MSDYADNDYEPTPDEIHDTFAYFSEAEPGHHGSIELIPTMERYIWLVEDVYWAHREVLSDGRIRFSWLKRPAPEAFTH